MKTTAATLRADNTRLVKENDQLLTELKHCFEDREDDKKTIAGYQIAAQELNGPLYVYRLTFREWENKPVGPGQDHADVMPSTSHTYAPQTVLAATGLKAAERLQEHYTGPIEIIECVYVCPLNVR